MWPEGISCDENFGYNKEDIFLRNKNSDFYFYFKLNYLIKNNFLINLLLDNYSEYVFNLTLKI